MISVKRIAVDLMLVFVAFLLLGELAFRLPGAVQKIAYDFDDEVGIRYRPNQVGVMFLGNFSVQTPEIVINNRGFRGGPIEPQRPSVLVSGSSEVVGPGVEENETLAASLELILGAEGFPHQVVSLGVGGHGPFHHSVITKRFVAELSPELVIVRASSGDRYFHRPTPEQLLAMKAKRLRNDQIANVSLFMPFLFNKVIAQLAVIKGEGERLKTMLKGEPQNPESAFAISQSLGEEMWDSKGRYWVSLMEEAEARDFNLVIVVPNPMALDADAFIASQLEAAAEKFPRTQVLELTTDMYPGTDSSRGSLGRWYADNYTLGYDPHGNAKHHRFVASSIVDSLDKAVLSKH
ncbi:MAG: hypothetical protein K0U72_07145 [Gammaproteobacteria bacterium]|nr:hypothetical protein [Gammaproteobacteria bacterium]